MENKIPGLDNDDKFTPKQRFFIKLLVCLITLIYAIIELIKIFKAT